MTIGTFSNDIFSRPLRDFASFHLIPSDESLGYELSIRSADRNDRQAANFPTRMFRLFLFICTCVLIFAASFRVSGQVDDGLVQVAGFDPRVGCETMELMLDGLLADASAIEGSTAYVVIHQGENAYDNAVVHRKALNHARFRRFPTERYRVIVTAGPKDILVTLWVVKDGNVPPVVAADLDVKISPDVSRIPSPEEPLELVKLDGRETYIPAENPSCLYGFDPSLIRELLDANPEFAAEIQVKTKSSNRYKKLVKILTTEFRELGVPTKRLKFVYAGQDKGQEGSGSKTASVTTTLIRISEN